MQPASNVEHICMCVYICMVFVCLFVCLYFGFGLRIRDLGIKGVGETVGKGGSEADGKREPSPALTRACSVAREDGESALLQFVGCCERVLQRAGMRRKGSLPCAQRTSASSTLPIPLLLAPEPDSPSWPPPPTLPLCRAPSPLPAPLATPCPRVLAPAMCAALANHRRTDPPLLLNQMARPAVVLLGLHFFPLQGSFWEPCRAAFPERCASLCWRSREKLGGAEQGQRFRDFEIATKIR